MEKRIIVHSLSAFANAPNALLPDANALYSQKDVTLILETTSNIVWGFYHTLDSVRLSQNSHKIHKVTLCLQTYPLGMYNVCISVLCCVSEKSLKREGGTRKEDGQRESDTRIQETEREILMERSGETRDIFHVDTEMNDSSEWERECGKGGQQETDRPGVGISRGERR